jgi:predicted enzyme related to lactoylglutathione lyase
MLGLSGSTLHFSLSVSDIDRSLEFFRQVLGYELQFVADDLTDEIARITGRPGLVCRLVQLAGPRPPAIELIEFHDDGEVPSSSSGPIPMAHIAYEVSNIDIALEACRRAGAELLGEVVEFPEGRCAYVREPGGAVVEFEEARDRGR